MVTNNRFHEGIYSREPVGDRKPQCKLEPGFARNIRKNTGAALEYLWEVSSSLRRPLVDIVVINGKERHSGKQFATLYIGNYENYIFILNLIYQEYSSDKIQKAKLPLGTTGWIQKYRKDVDLVFMDLELLYGKFLHCRDWLAIPQWVRQKFIVPDSWTEVLAKFRKNTKKTDLRKVRKYCFSYRLTTNESEYERFYEQMYRPYLEKRFKDEVIIEPKWKVLRQCRKGRLMQILRDGEVVAAVLLHNREGRLAYVWVGVPDNISKEMYNGAFSALYYYTILYGYSTGCREIDFLGSRPLLNDGLFLYKRKWGTFVQDSPVPRGDIYLRPLSFTTAIRSVFTNNFFISRDGCDLIGKLLYDRDRLDKKQIISLISRHFTPGLKHIKICCLNGYDKRAEAWAKEQNEKISLVDISTEKDPAKAFCTL